MSDAAFAMMTCAHGAEKAVKVSMAESGWRLAFSRPGFVTAKNDDHHAALPGGPFVRTAAHSIGQARSEHLQDQLASLQQQLEQSPYGHQTFDELHLWPKDRLPIGRFGFEPGIDEVSRMVAAEVFAALGSRWLRCDAPNRIAQPDASVLDVVMVDPSHWFFGTHHARSMPARWPGGVQPLEPRYEPISRAYYKAAEAIAWSGFEMKEGDVAVEIGSAPGGACGRLLELGLHVIGIDPADMDPRIAGHPRLKHLRARAGDLPRSAFRGAKWLLVDSNVRPDKSLTTIENIITHRHSEFKGLLITLKIGNYEAADRMNQWRQRMESWHPKTIHVRQLARNKVEVCFAITF